MPLSNRRIFYAIQAMGIAPYATTSFTAVKGLQSVGITTKFNLEQAFEIGQLAIYQNIENLPDIEVTSSKVLDGYPLIGHLATQGALDATLVGRSNQRCQVALSIYGDSQNSSSGTPLSQCTCSGMYFSSWGFDVNTQGNATESVTLVGNNKTWLTSSFTFSPNFTNADAPSAASGVNRRQHVDMTNSRWPVQIPGITSSGTNPQQTDGSFTAHLASFKASTNLGRDQLLELGNRGPYFRFVTFPVEVKTDIEVTSSQGDQISATEAGVLGSGNNITDEHIFLQMNEGTKIELGTHNKLQTVTYGGANAGTRGGNATVTYSYINYNDMKVTHPADPSGLT